MRATALLFAPVVLGVTGSLYAVLADAFGGVASLPMPPATFHLALGVYLLATIAGIVHFATRIERGSGFAAFGSTLAVALPAGFAVFLATLALSGLVLGGH